MRSIRAGDMLLCINSNAVNPWHRENPLTVGAYYTALHVRESWHADGRRMNDMIRVDNSGRFWGSNNFQRVGLDEDDFVWPRKNAAEAFAPSAAVGS